MLRELSQSSTSPDGRHIAYVVRALVGGLLVAVDGSLRPWDRYEAVGTPIFSPDSKRVAYKAVQRDKRFVVLDGKEGKKHEGLVTGSSIVFDSPDGLHYLARKGNGVYLTDERIERGPAGRRRDLLRRYKPLVGEWYEAPTQADRRGDSRPVAANQAPPQRWPLCGLGVLWGKWLDILRRHHYLATRVRIPRRQGISPYFFPAASFARTP